LDNCTATWLLACISATAWRERNLDWIVDWPRLNSYCYDRAFQSAFKGVVNYIDQLVSQFTYSVSKTMTTLSNKTGFI